MDLDLTGKGTEEVDGVFKGHPAQNDKGQELRGPVRAIRIREGLPNAFRMRP